MSIAPTAPKDTWPCSELGRLGTRNGSSAPLEAIARAGSLPISSQGLSRLCAFKVQRREIAVAVFSGLKLDFVQRRQFPADWSKAESSSLGFLHWVSDNLEVDSAALERLDSQAPSRRGDLTDSLRVALRGLALSLCEPSKEELLTSFAIPEPKTRKDVRQIVCEIWPILQTMHYDPAILDAAALGLYSQAQRLINS